jgi:hypothetical protein
MQQGKAPRGPGGYEIRLHHIIPLEYGGTNEFSNLRPMLYAEHSLKPYFGPLHIPPFE